MMPPIRTEEDYRAAVARIGELVVRPDAETNEELELLSVLVQAYEVEQVPEVPMEPADYLKASMENRGLTQADLAPLFGSSTRGGGGARWQARAVQGDDPRAGFGMGA